MNDDKQFFHVFCSHNWKKTEKSSRGGKKLGLLSEHFSFRGGYGYVYWMRSRVWLETDISNKMTFYIHFGRFDYYYSVMTWWHHKCSSLQPIAEKEWKKRNLLLFESHFTSTKKKREKRMKHWNRLENIELEIVVAVHQMWFSCFQMNKIVFYEANVVLYNTMENGERKPFLCCCVFFSRFFHSFHLQNRFQTNIWIVQTHDLSICLFLSFRRFCNGVRKKTHKYLWYLFVWKCGIAEGFFSYTYVIVSRMPNHWHFEKKSQHF